LGKNGVDLEKNISDVIYPSGHQQDNETNNLDLNNTTRIIFSNFVDEDGNRLKPRWTRVFDKQGSNTKKNDSPERNLSGDKGTIDGKK